MSRKNGVQPVEPVPDRELSPEQDLVIAELLAGATDAEAADRCGVSARTIGRWRASDSLFVAALNDRREQVWRSHKDALRSLLTEAIGILAADVRDPDPEVRRAAARAVVRLFGRDLDLRPSGPTTEKAVRNDWATEQLFSFDFA